MSKHDDEEIDYASEEEDDGSDLDEPRFRKTVKTARTKKPATAAVLHDPDEEEDSSDEEEDGSDDDKSEDADSDVDSQADPEEEEGDEPANSANETGVRSKQTVSRFAEQYDDDDDDEEEDEEDDHYLQKFDEGIKSNIINQYHPELLARNYDEVDILTRVVRNEAGVIVDPLHKTLPFLTKYERARILGERAKQIDAGAKPFVEVDPSIIDGYLIALAEFGEKKIPFIVKRPLPNGGCEYWKLRDLEILDY
jgi:DNA-directed RNA polymerase I, II, and III subunit RPABC2